MPAHPNNYLQGRNGNAIRYIVIHDTEGSYQGAISWFQNPNSGVSAHYVLRSRDGELAREAMASHLRLAREDALRHMRGLEQRDGDAGRLATGQVAP